MGYGKANPFLKWVGGKRSIIRRLADYMPKKYSGYFEPFIGGGALFFELEPENAQLSDINEKLITTYLAVRDNVEELIWYLRKHKEMHGPEYYYHARNCFNDPNLRNNAYIGSLLIYLNKTCFNGLYRVNSSGKFNVSLGSYKNPLILDEDNLRACSAALESVEIFHRDFSEIRPEKGQFFYLDPPYHDTFTQYSSGQFSEEDHMRLLEFCKKIDSAGGYFMVSNADTEFIRKLYGDFHISAVNASRRVSCKKDSRKAVQELIIRNYQ